MWKKMPKLLDCLILVKLLAEDLFILDSIGTLSQIDLFWVWSVAQLLMTKPKLVIKNRSLEINMACPIVLVSGVQNYKYKVCPWPQEQEEGSWTIEVIYQHNNWYERSEMPAQFGSSQWPMQELSFVCGVHLPYVVCRENYKSRHTSNRQRHC